MKKIYASALLQDGKLKFWKVSDRAKKDIHDWYKEFYYAQEKLVEFKEKANWKIEIKEFEQLTDEDNKHIFDVLSVEWFKQFKLVEPYKGKPPYGEKRFEPFIVTSESIDYKKGYKQAIADLNKPILMITENWDPSKCPRCDKSFYDYEECDDGYYDRATSLERCPYCGQKIVWHE